MDGLWSMARVGFSIQYSVHVLFERLDPSWSRTFRIVEWESVTSHSTTFFSFSFFHVGERKQKMVFDAFYDEMV